MHAYLVDSITCALLCVVQLTIALVTAKKAIRLGEEISITTTEAFVGSIIFLALSVLSLNSYRVEISG